MKQFPEFPTDPQSLGLLQSLRKLSQMIGTSNQDEDLNNCSRYLILISGCPTMHPKFYYDLYTKLSDPISHMSEYYNKAIYRRGQQYMLDTLNAEVGNFAHYFDQFQLLMYSINERANWDERLTPFNQLIWGFYCSLFDAQIREDYFLGTFAFAREYYRDENAQFN